MKPLFKLYLYFIACFFIIRLVLFGLYYERFSDVDEPLLMSFLHGLRMDTIVASALLFIPALLLGISPVKYAKQSSNILMVYSMLALGLIIYVGAATFPFMAQFDARPNHLFIEYLEYPQEVIGLLLADYKLPLFLCLLLIVMVLTWFYRTQNKLFLPTLVQPWLKRIVVLPFVILILIMGVRSSFGHRSANNSDAMFSSHRILNEVTKNSFYNIIYAVYSTNRHGAKSLEKYGKISTKEALTRSQKLLGISGEGFSRSVPSHFPQQKPKNLVIFVQESVGAQFVEAIGGEAGIMPNLSKLANEGISFANLYANGTRSVRGLAGLTSGFLAVPGKGVVKRNKSQSDFFTVASLLRPLGYHTVFLYGGESRFDSMRSWFLGNGFDQIIDEPKFTNPSFVGTWGVSDEDLVRRANQEFAILHQSNKPFVAVMFSTSNHMPFDFPENKIDLLPNVPKKSVKNAIKYADHAIGEFISQAKKQAYYKDTIFVIAADHNVRVYGDEIVPVEMFRVPAIIIGEGIKPQKITRLSSQPDVLATALDLLGTELRYPILGNSVFMQGKKDFALMKFNNTYALRKDNKVAILQEGFPPETFTFNKTLTPTEHDVDLEKDALALIFTLQHLYENKQF